MHAFFGVEPPAPKPAAIQTKSTSSFSASLPSSLSTVSSLSPSVSSASIPTSSLPLADKQFVITGVLDGISRDDVTDYILTYGGKVKGAISRAVDYLLAGRFLEDGRDVTEGTKYKAAIEKKVQGDITS